MSYFFLLRVFSFQLKIIITRPLTVSLSARRFIFNRVESSDDNTDIEEQDEPDSDDVTDAEGDDDVTDVEGGDDDGDDTDSFIVPDSQG